MVDDSDLQEEGVDSDIPLEQPLPATDLGETEAPAPKATSNELEYDSDVDLLTEEQASGQSEKPREAFFPEDHWSNDKVFGKEPMTKAHPPGFVPRFSVIIPSMGNEDIQRVGEALGPVLKQLTPDARAWLDTMLNSQLMLMANDNFAASLQRDGSTWRQSPEHDGVKIVAQVPGHAQVAPGTVLTGADAQVHMAHATKSYARLMFPLPHSGIWLNVTIPHGSELHTLEENIATAKFDLGWLSKGLVYSNTSVMQNIVLVNFILERVQAASMENASLENMKKWIRVTDINMMAAHMASAIYPSGFPLERPCSADPLKCHEVVSGILRLSKIIWTDDSGLSASQMKFMSTRISGRKKTEDELRKYQEEFPGVTQRVVEIGSGISVRFMPPTIEQYEQSGYSWIESIERGANQMLTTLNQAQLNKYMTEQYQMSSMRQYAHWVDAILFPNDVSVTGREDINNLLAQSSTDTDMVDKFMAAVKAFIDDCAVSVVAIDNYKCPKCGGSQTHEAAKNPKLIPLDPIHTFFTLSGLKTQTTLLRNTEH